jgi:hypothetical protein
VPDRHPEPDPRTSRPPPALVVASVLCWLCGTVAVLGGAGLFLAAVAVGSPSVSAAVLALAFLITGIGFWVAGYWIGKQRRAGAWIAVACSALVAGVEIRGRTPGTWAMLAVSVGIVLLIVANWRRFDGPGRVRGG